MLDEVQKTFVRSFISYLKKQVGTQALTPDAQESVEVAVQCLQAAFDVGEDEEDEPQVQESQPLAATATSATETAASSTAPTVAVDPKEIDLFELFQSLYIERNPQSLQMAESIKNEGNRLMKDGKYNEALLQYNRAITFDPKNPIFYCNRAAAYIRLGDNERAITDCKSALVYNNNYGKAYGRLGIAFSNLGKFNEAMQAYAKAIELEPDNQDYRNNMEVARTSQEQMRASSGGMRTLTDGINMMLANPNIRNLFNNAEMDLEQLQNMSQNPLVMDAIGQMFTGAQASAGGTGSGQAPQPLPKDMMQLFQTFASQLANAAHPGGRQVIGNGGNQPGPQQEPPSS